MSNLGKKVLEDIISLKLAYGMRNSMNLAWTLQIFGSLQNKEYFCKIQSHYIYNNHLRTVTKK